MKLKGKVYKTVVRQAMLYGAGTWATTRGQEARLGLHFHLHVHLQIMGICKATC